MATMRTRPLTGATASTVVAADRSRDDATASERAAADRRLFRRYADARDPVDRDAIVERFLPLARQIAARYQRRGEPFEDIFQVACFGLVKAVDRFDPARGIAFSSYAVPTIAGEIKRYFRDFTWAVRVPRDLQDLALRVERVIGELTERLGRQPSVEEVADATGTDPEALLEAMHARDASRAASLQAPRSGTHEVPAETLGDTLGRAEDGFRRVEQRADLASLLRALPAREREVLLLRFEADLTQAEIGARIGVSQMQVSRILRHAMADLRALAADARSGPIGGLPAARGDASASERLAA
jgi:RNA polymerase sigma-B factor